jgi:FKBP-type peptidyl-prolyl cis-trans isomerase FkpA
MIKKLSLYAIVLLGCLALFNSCKKEYEPISVADAQNIKDYLTKNNITGTSDTLGYTYKVTNVGTGNLPSNQDSIYYTYEFKHASNATIFKSSDYFIPETYLGYSDNVTIPSSPATVRVIPAMRYTLSKLKKGGSAIIILPSAMAFGKNGNTSLGVESNEIVIIEVKTLPYLNQVQVDDAVLDKFVANNSLTPLQHTNRVRYIISAEGTGKADLKATSTVTVKYTGRLLNGTVFDSNDTGYTLALDDFISGWYTTLPGKIGVGGKIRLLIPSGLAYGKDGIKDSSSGTYSIPPNACLDFDIEITAIKN